MNVKSRTKKILCLIYNGVCQIINCIIAHFPPPQQKNKKQIKTPIRILQYNWPIKFNLEEYIQGHYIGTNTFELSASN